MDIERPKSLSMTVLMTPDLANFSGAVHGGALMRLLDQVAYSCAARYCRTYVVTLFVDQVYFREPVNVGDLVTFKANVNYTGNTTLEVGIRTEAAQPTELDTRHVMSCYFTMMSKDDAGQACAVPPLEITEDVERRLFEAGRMRREMRKEMMERNRALHVGGLDAIRP
ncbi:MAG: acyl-CoA thioesterase [Pseudomonadales bacterium]|jgi:acyl-CoA hydrolase|nr:acyl-CoA thioesterase [Pseudomonadales bacterium]